MWRAVVQPVPVNRIVVHQNHVLRRSVDIQVHIMNVHRINPASVINHVLVIRLVGIRTRRKQVRFIIQIVVLIILHVQHLVKM